MTTNQIVLLLLGVVYVVRCLYYLDVLQELKRHPLQSPFRYDVFICIERWMSPVSQVPILLLRALSLSRMKRKMHSRMARSLYIGWDSIVLLLSGIHLTTPWQFTDTLAI